MHGKFVQISAVMTPKGFHVVYALDENGLVYEKIGQQAWSIVE